MSISLTAVNKLFDHIHNFWIWRRNCSKPYESDKKRYELVMKTINMRSIYHFRHDENNPFFANHIFDGMEENSIYLNGGIYLPSFKNGGLLRKEKKLAKTAKRVFDEIHNNIDATPNAGGYRIQDTSKKKMLKLDKASKKLIHAFEKFRDYGNKLFGLKVGT